MGLGRLMSWPEKFSYWYRSGIRNSRGAKALSAHKAAEMLRDGTVRGEPLTAKQTRLFQAVAHGMRPRGRKAG